MINYKEIDYKNFGKCLKIDNGCIELIVSCYIGPRILHFGFIGGENTFFEDIERKSFRDLSKEGCFTEDTWYIYGGHRFWVSPEEFPRTYYPDNNEIKVTKTKNGVLLEQGVQEWTNLCLSIDISFSGDNKLLVKHILKNCHPHEVTVAPWAISIGNQGGLCAVLNTMTGPDLLPDRRIELWGYTDLRDERAYFGRNIITLRQDNQNEDAFKIGLPNKDGLTAYYINNNLFVKKYEYQEGEVYPDGGMSTEVYTNDLILEIETLGPLKTLSYLESTEHTETWILQKDVPAPKPDDEATIFETLKKYL